MWASVRRKLTKISSLWPCDCSTNSSKRASFADSPIAAARRASSAASGSAAAIRSSDAATAAGWLPCAASRLLNCIRETVAAVPARSLRSGRGSVSPGRRPPSRRPARLPSPARCRGCRKNSVSLRYNSASAPSGLAMHGLGVTRRQIELHEAPRVADHHFAQQRSQPFAVERVARVAALDILLLEIGLRFADGRGPAA